MAEPIKITVQGVLEDLKKGYTRTISDRQYKGEKMSIEEKSTETPSITSTTSIEESSETIDENVSEEEHAAESTSDEDPSWMA